LGAFQIFMVRRKAPERTYFGDVPPALWTSRQVTSTISRPPTTIIVMSHQLNGPSDSVGGPSRMTVEETDLVSVEGKLELSVIAATGLAGSFGKIHVTASRHRNIMVT
jgi:hypothetical protein